MNEYTKTEIAVGLFVIAGLVAIAYLSVSIAGLDLFVGDRTNLVARFASVGDLKEGAAVKIAGVQVGAVKSIRLDRYAAEAQLAVDPEVALPADTIASIRTEGLLGEAYVMLRPGGSDKNLAAGDRVAQTEPAIDLIDLVVKYALSSDSDSSKDKGGGDELPGGDPLEDL